MESQWKTSPDIASDKTHHIALLMGASCTYTVRSVMDHPDCRWNTRTHAGQPVSGHAIGLVVRRIHCTRISWGEWGWLTEQETPVEYTIETKYVMRLAWSQTTIFPFIFFFLRFRVVVFRCVDAVGTCLCVDFDLDQWSDERVFRLRFVQFFYLWLSANYGGGGGERGVLVYVFFLI